MKKFIIKLFIEIFDCSEKDANHILFIILILWVCFNITTMIIGIENADESKVCRIRKPIEIITMAPLFIGCQLGKERFEINLN